MNFKPMVYLRRRWARIRAEFRKLWKNYLYQSCFATVVIFIILLLLSLEHAVVIASIGATAFIIFTMPRSVTAKPRRVIGGHTAGFICACCWDFHSIDGVPRCGASSCKRDCAWGCHYRLLPLRNAGCHHQQHCFIPGTPLL